MESINDMQFAAWQLKLLTASDPSAVANMMRHAAALSLLLTGRRQRNKLPGEPEISACFLLDNVDINFLTEISRKTGIDHILVEFDVDDAAGPACGLAVVQAIDKKVAPFRNCRLWMPAHGGRAVLVPQASKEIGYFAFRKGGSLRNVFAPPAVDRESGFRRAARRYTQLTDSPELRDIGREGYMHVISNDNGVLCDRVTSLSS